MKTKLFLTAVAVTFSFAMMSCSGNKTANTATQGETETVESATGADSCCQANDSCTAVCGKKADCCEKQADCCEQKKDCCEKKAACAEKKECCNKE